MEFEDCPSLLGYLMQKPAVPFADINYYKRTAHWGRRSHAHDYYQFFIVTSGTLTLNCDGSRVLTQGYASLIPPNYLHELFTETGYEQIGANLYAEGGDLLGILPLLKTYVNTPIITEDFRFLQRNLEMLQLMANNSSIAQSKACLIMSDAILRSVESIAYGSEDRFDARLSHYLESNLDAGLSTARVAEHFHMSVPQLERLARRYFGSGVIALYNQRRLAKARVLLMNTDKNISEIAQQTGFFDSAHFSSFFHKNMGVSPSQYRKTEK